METSHLRLVSIHVEFSAHGEDLSATTSKAIIAVSVGGARADLVTAEGEDEAAAIFKGIKESLVDYFPEIKDVVMERTEAGVFCKNNSKVWPVKSAMGGSKSIASALIGVMDEAVAEFAAKPVGV